ncbi:MAG: ABC-ATPase domain-containing protein [Eubacterium sp.]|jgi:predicted ABC-class ATPase|nr:ABC-ATPase domain-containing protein [Eubacterium sp.]
MKQAEDLKELLGRIDRRGYPAYKDTAGAYQFRNYVLSIDHVQGDPFAAPSKVSVIVGAKQAEFPEEYYQNAWRKAALQDMLIRRFYQRAERFSFQAKGSGKSGMISVSRPGQKILERSACQINGTNGTIVFRLEVGFPANGRTVNARELGKILFDFLPECIEDSLYYRAYQKKAVADVIALSDDQQFIREELKKQGLAAFAANGSVLPRATGVSDRPMQNAVTFTSPASMEVSMQLPHAGELRGMGIKKGITLIVGGGYHGKSTLLKALEAGIYNHIAGDGREYVITDDTAVKIRAEDGRSVKATDISMFIGTLPNGKDTKRFSTEDASGSTSQAANMIEAMEAGANVFLIDEDTSATNFMIRDELMQRVVHRESEPITPFIDRVQELYQRFGISTILVAGSCGSYFHKADTVLQMNQYVPMDVTEAAKAEAAHFPLALGSLTPAKEPEFKRMLFAVKPGGRDRMKIKAMGKDALSIDKKTVDLRYVEQIADTEQVVMLGCLLKYVLQNLSNGKKTVQEIVDELFRVIGQKGMEGIYGGRYLPTGLAMPRKQEVFACLNRYRG